MRDRDLLNALSSGKTFKVDEIACKLHADQIRGYVREDQIGPWSIQSPAMQLAFKISFISICHQFNWDFLQDTLAKKLLTSNEHEFLHRLTTVKASDLSSWLADYPKQERVRAKERVQLLRDVGLNITSKFGSCAALYGELNGRPLSVFREKMEGFRAYRNDPLKKKTNVLTHDLFKEQILEFADPENIEPAVDYHIMRLYLRTGRVVPERKSLIPFLEGRPNPRGTLIRALRIAVSEAEQLTAQMAGLNVADVNFIEWQVGRAVCKNAVPLCEASVVPDLANDVSALCTSGCPYSTSCLAYTSMHSFLQFEEPTYASTDY
ncbi:MAG: hypothetical protein AB7I04_08480 [Pseudomonadales bacterium]